MGIALRIDPTALVQVAGPFSRVAFVLLVIVEVVVAPIPGGVIAFLASAAWGFWQSWPLHYLGNVVGGLLVFWLAKTLGKPFVDRHVDTRRPGAHRGLAVRSAMAHLDRLRRCPSSPVDTVSIALGVSAMPRRRFAFVLLTAPSLLHRHHGSAGSLLRPVYPLPGMVRGRLSWCSWSRPWCTRGSPSAGVDRAEGGLGESFPSAGV